MWTTLNNPSNSLLISGLVKIEELIYNLNNKVSNVLNKVSNISSEKLCKFFENFPEELPHKDANYEKFLYKCSIQN